MGDEAEVSTLGQVLADEAIGVFVCTALPWAVWVAEIDRHIKALGEFVVHGHLGTSIVGHGLAHEFWNASQAFDECVSDMLRAGVIKLGEHDHSSDALDECANG